ILDDHAGVHGDVVLDLDVVADDGAAIDVDVLTDDASLADACVLHDVREVPDLRARADGGPVVDEGRLVHDVRPRRPCSPGGGGGGIEWPSSHPERALTGREDAENAESFCAVGHGN